MQTFQAKRMALRMPLSFPLRCQLANSKELGGKAINLSTGGISLSTNSPIKTKEQLSVELQVPDTLSPLSLSGEVAWSQFHYDTPKAEDTLFKAGIKFLTPEKSYRGLLLDCLLNLFWKEYLFGFRDIQELLPDVQNLALEEKRIVIHNYNFCLLFVERRCPHQRMMERALLIPQILNAYYLMKCQDICWYCSVYRERPFRQVSSA
jgi:hypothetical protein